MPNSLLLFDIDGTLLKAGRAHGAAMAEAFVSVYGVPPKLDGYDPAGRTDCEIISDIARRQGVAEERIQEGCRASSRLP